MFIVTKRKFFFILSGLALAAAIAALLLWGLKFGIEFTGGTLVDVQYTGERPAMTAVEGAIDALDIELGGFSLRPAGEDRVLLRTRPLSESETTVVTDALALGGTAEIGEPRVTTIGPVIGSELRSKALVAILLVTLMVVLYIAFVFRKVSKPVSSLYYGLVTVLALAHNILIPLGLFAAFGHFLGYEVDILFVVAILTILGYSVMDTIVVFDRIRENLRVNTEARREEPFDEVVGRSLRQVITRSINTSATTTIVAIVLFFLGAEATRQFALVISVGVIVGTYSSLCFASPLLVTIERWQRKRTKTTS